MSKQAREICIRCPKCGEFEVPVDWSKCARKEVQIVRCDKCGTEFAYCSAHRGRIVLARRKRKNREARLRHKIAVLKKQVKKAYEKGIEVEHHANNLHRAREEGSCGILKKEIQWDDLSVDDWRTELAREYELELTIDTIQRVLSEAHYLYMYCDEGKIIVTDCDVDYYAFVNAEYLITENIDVESSERFYKWEPSEGVWLPQNVVGTADNADDAYKLASTDWYGRHKQVIRTVWEHYGPEDEVNWRIAYHILGQAEMTPLKFSNEKGDQK